MKMNESRMFTYQSRVKETACFGILDAFGDLYGCMERSLFKELILQTTKLSSLKSSFLIRFGVTARQFNSCFYTLRGKIRSIVEVRNRHIERLKTQISELEKKVPAIKSKKLKHLKKRSLKKLIHRIEELRKNKEQGKVSLCFGSKKLFHAQFHLDENDYTSHDEWKKDWKRARCSEFFCIGSKDEVAGNQTCTLIRQEGGSFYLRLRLPNALIEQHGKYCNIPISFPYGGKEIERALECQQALSYRFKKDEKGWRVFVSFEKERPALLSNEELGAIGIDINVNHIAIAEIDPQGNPVSHKTIPLCTYGKSKNQTKALIGDAVKEIVALAKEKGKPIIHEALDFTKKKMTLKKEIPKQARMLSSFHYSQFIQNLKAKAFSTGISTFSVNPAMTSIIGKIKFSKRYGLTTHHGAALVIARRHYKFSESPSKMPMQIVHKQFHVTCSAPVRKPKQHVWGLWRVINRKLQAVLAALHRDSLVQLI